ncbi:hypothetical protein UlMin_017440 [Ulmus minor]
MRKQFLPKSLKKIQRRVNAFKKWGLTVGVRIMKIRMDFNSYLLLRILYEYVCLNDIPTKRYVAVIHGWMNVIIIHVGWLNLISTSSKYLEQNRWQEYGFWFWENAGPWFVVRSLVPLQHLLQFLKQAGGISYSVYTKPTKQCNILTKKTFYQKMLYRFTICNLSFIFTSIDFLWFFLFSSYINYKELLTLRDLPLGIGAALSICCPLYVLVSVVVVGLVPFHAMDPDTPISSVFSSHGMQWDAYIIIVGAVIALCSTLMGSLLLQPRIFMAMSRDGLLVPFFLEGNKRTQVPLKSTEATGIGAAILAFFMDISQSMLIVRYVPPDEVPLPSSLQESIDAFSLKYAFSHLNMHTMLSNFKNKRRKIASWTIMLTCIGPFLLTYSASSLGLPGFMCMFMPLLPISILINVYLLINLGATTWARVSVWLLTSVLVSVFYGRTHSSLHDAVYVLATHADEIYCKSPEYVA